MTHGVYLCVFLISLAIWTTDLLNVFQTTLVMFFFFTLIVYSGNVFFILVMFSFYIDGI